jgi:hypothetical protein
MPFLRLRSGAALLKILERPSRGRADYSDARHLTRPKHMTQPCAISCRIDEAAQI